MPHSQDSPLYSSVSAGAMPSDIVRDKREKKKRVSISHQNATTQMHITYKHCTAVSLSIHSYGSPQKPHHSVLSSQASPHHNLDHTRPRPAPLNPALLLVFAPLEFRFAMAVDEPTPAQAALPKPKEHGAN